MEFRIRRHDGQWSWVLARGRVVERDSEGWPLRTAGTVADIAEPRRADDAIRTDNTQLETPAAKRSAEMEMGRSLRERRDSEGCFRDAVEASSLGLWDWNMATGVVRFSPAFGAMLGDVPAGRALTWQDRVHPDECAAVADIAERLLRGADTCERECRFRVRDGGYRWMLTRGRVMEREANGVPLRVVGSCTDIDALKWAEALNRRLAAIIEASGDLISTATPSGRVDYMNSAGRALLGFDATEPLERTLIQDCYRPSAYRRVADEGIPAALAQGV